MMAFGLGLFATAVLLSMDIMLISHLLTNRVKNSQLKQAGQEQKAVLLQLLSGLNPGTKARIPVSNYLELKESVQFDQARQEIIAQSVKAGKFEKKHIRLLKSRSRINRMEAAVNLGLLGSSTARLALEKSILEEKDYPVKLYMANALADIADPESVPLLVASLMNSNHWYRDRVNLLICGFGESFNLYLPNIINNPQIEMKELIVDFAAVFFTRDLPAYLTKLIDSAEDNINQLPSVFGNEGVASCANCVNGRTINDDGWRWCRLKGPVSPGYKCKRYELLPVSISAADNYRKLVYKAARVLASFYPRELNQEKYLQASDPEIRRIAVNSLANLKPEESVKQLLVYLSDDDTVRSAVYALSQIIEKHPEHLNTLVDLFTAHPDAMIKQGLAEVLAGKIEYFIMKLAGKNRRVTGAIIKQVLLLNRSSEVIDFLNKNRDIDLENELIHILKEAVPHSRSLEAELCNYLDPRLLRKCGLARCELINGKHKDQDFKQIGLLYSLMAGILLLFPVIYAVRHFDLLFTMAPAAQIRIFVVEFNYYLAFYSLAISFIYFGLLLLSNYQVQQQQRLWRLKNASLLFKDRILPSISIIAPAYNEEKTIVESANSLLNLKYPDYELIIVNDGSQDGTLNVLIKSFDLTRVDYIFDYRLNTQPVRGVYVNRSLPKLVVVDKGNGGKADSLNAGINISNKEYFCGIDADSLLEEEALLKLASITLDEGIETPALGGNIFPINGCTVERGQIKSIHIPKNRWARFQTIEYIRAFMAGRLGWARLNSLLIISGAFGLFRKERVVSVGGYLTSSGRYGKDTVGEDMELVVRISRLMREKKHRYRVCYAFHANCWTEVPEDLRSLKNQRYRWQRGLIDILTFHKKMLFNPRYGRVGLLAMPYFFIFEMIGPIIEIQGYLMVLTAFLLGLLNPELALLLFIATVLMGVLISIASLVIAEKDSKYFSLKDILLLITYAILENFGPRQLFSLWRVGGYISMLKNSAGWGKIERKGFSPTISPSDPM